jgi:hypothetical protein
MGVCVYLRLSVFKFILSSVSAPVSQSAEYECKMV